MPKNLEKCKRDGHTIQNPALFMRVPPTRNDITALALFRKRLPGSLTESSRDPCSSGSK